MVGLTIAMLSLHSSPLGRLGERDTGGMSVFLLETAIGLGKRGHVVDLFTLEAGIPETRVDQLAENVRLVHLPYSLGDTVKKDRLYDYIPDVFKGYCDFIREEGRLYSVVHSHYWLSAWLGKMICERFHLPHLVSFHTLAAIKNSVCSGENEPEVRLEKERILATCCDKIIVFTEEDRKKFISLYNISEDGIGVVPCGVNLERFTPVERGHARKKLNFQEDEILLLFVGRYVPIKGIDLLVEAVALLAEKYDVRLILVGGDGRGSAEFERVAGTITECGIEHQVHVAGRVAQEDLVLYYSAADALMVGSYYESFCLTVLEALACGTPVIGSAVGCLPEVIGKGAGVVVARPSGVDLASAVKDFLFRKGEARLPPYRIREFAASYTWDRTVESLELQYNHVLKSEGGSILG